MTLSRNKKTTYLINQIAIREESFFARYLFNYLEKQGFIVDQNAQLVREYYGSLCKEASDPRGSSCFEAWLENQTATFVGERIVG